MVCRLHGKLGLSFGDKYRHYIMLSAFCVSFTAWILQFAAIAALSTNTGTVENVYWAKADMIFNATQYPPHGATMTSYMGINRRIDKIGVYTNELKVSTTETTYNRDWDTNTTCQLASTGEYFPGCKQCGDTATGTATLLITSVITQIFQMTTDLQRTTRYGDLHCQKSLGTITGIYGFYSTLQSMHNFMSDCALTEWDWFSAHTEMTDSGTLVGFDNGTGLTLLFVATVFKLYDVLCHVIVPVAEKQNEYIPQDDCCSDDALSLEDYMGRNTVITSWNNATGTDMLKEEVAQQQAQMEMQA